MSLGARKIILEAVGLRGDDNLIVLTHEKYVGIANQIIKAAKSVGIKNVLLIQIPECLRPLDSIPKALIGAIAKAEALIYIVDRMPEETPITWGPLMNLCKEYKCKYFVMYDPKQYYLEKGGVVADYNVVDDKCKKVCNILKQSRKIHVTSDIGTDVTFELSNVTYRSPIITLDALERGDVMRQIPEGEVWGVPIENTFTGKIVVDGAITGIGIPEIPITWIFEKGQTTSVKGPQIFLSMLLESIRRSDRTVESLIGIRIAEFAVGTNDWAFFDENISNSEKVAGSVHFGIEKGNSHIDNVLTKPTVIVTDTKGREICLIENGKLRV